jgi:CRP/FNR family transcriptional regulator, cyclic AMP receptor protein
VKSRNPADYAELLFTGRWFSGLPTAFRDALLGAATVRALRAAETLFSRGDPPCGLYAVLDGALRISGTSESGKEALLIFTEPPSWFGEIAVFDDLPRTHDAIAEQESLVLNVSQSATRAILEKEPRWWQDLGLLVTMKLRLALLAMEDVSLFPLSVRLARRLLLMAEGYGERNAFTKRVVEVRQEQLAMMLSASRQTTNQLLKELEAAGVIRISYGEVEIVDLDALTLSARLQR